MNNIRMTSSPPSSKSPKLKFGVERLLQPDGPRAPLEEPRGQLVAPRPTVAVPCSDCVTSLLRCCSLGPNHQEIGHYPNYGHLHAPQPVRPFATRPPGEFTFIVAPSDYRLFPNLKNTWKEWNSQALKEAVNEGLTIC